MTNNPRYTLGTEANRIFMASETYELLKFGKGFPAPDGGSGWLNADGTLDPSHGVETWITSRMAHVYSIGAMLGYPGAGELADAALRGLTGILHDDEHGGWYPQVFADGTHAPGKVCYAHAFVILAASSALLAGRPGAKELLDEALATYDKHFWDDEIGLAVDTWNTEFTELDPYRGLNANMHTTEAFLAVADATGNNTYRVRAGRIIDHVIEWAEHNGWRIPEHFKSDWSVDLECNADKKDDQFKPYGATPGHGIEWARLIVQWALSSFANRDGARPYIDAAEHLFARAVDDAFCERLAGFANLARHFHLSMQSGCVTVLRRMNRHYTSEEFYRCVERLRRAFPDCSVTTDLIVGFPGETEDEFEQTLAFLERCAFASVHVFPYSVREGTKSAAMPGQLDQQTKTARAERAKQVAETLSTAYRKQFVGRTLYALPEHPTGGLWAAHGRYGFPVYIEDKAEKNHPVTVKVIGLHKDGVLAKIEN